MDSPTEDIVVTALKEKYFTRISHEKYPLTPLVTEELDNIEKAIKEIRERQK